MPALITHHLFGEEASLLMPAGLLSGQEEKLAFLLGNQGPDPFFFRFSTLPSLSSSCYRLAHLMHDERIVEAFLALRDGVSHLREEDKEVGRAFVLGMLAHYTLDSRAHPFVYAQQAALIEANPELEGAENEVHALIESDLDVWMLWSMRHQTVAQSAPSARLDHTQRTTRVAGALLSQLAWQVYGISIDAFEYDACVNDCRLIYQVIEPAGSPLGRGMGLLETTLRQHSQLMALAHRVSESDECPACNLEHHVWADPSSGKRRQESFPDLFFRALEVWNEMVKALAAGDERALRELVGKVNYDGRPTQGR
ncbi:zinc dependent phospholipase C family protein [Olsenella urininfantis]|uniref:zinc dependent phospholipase C family protein n=1 Tax=Olsenella urininfantis TaxID=1871033 RepID=UPI000986E27E|nr:zinc dependent phospholipase C family protein [Olsenella urininfantis]